MESVFFEDVSVSKFSDTVCDESTASEDTTELETDDIIVDCVIDVPPSDEIIDEMLEDGVMDELSAADDIVEEMVDSSSEEAVEVCSVDDNRTDERVEEYSDKDEETIEGTKEDDDEDVTTSDELLITKEVEDSGMGVIM